jgi:adenylate cyclase
MTDIFISYARSTEPQAKQIAEALRALGYGVWRDDELPAHRAYAEVIEERLKAATAVVVVWSADAVKSEWVRSEADKARADRKLVQLSLDGSPPPMPFDQIQCADMTDWTGDLDATGWRKVVSSIGDLVGGATSVHFLSVPAPLPLPLPGNPSIAVMPFANLSGDPEQEYFADGMVEEIATALSRIRSIFVIGASSSLSLKGQQMPPQEVARRLGVRYVLEGSVRMAGGRVRIGVKLVDAANGSQIWADRFEDTLDDIFALQDKVALAVAGKIEPAVLNSEIQQAIRRPTDNLSSYDLTLKALPLALTFSKPEVVRALDLFDRATLLDPHYGKALIGAAFCHGLNFANAWSEDPEAHRVKAADKARRGIAAAGDDTMVLQTGAEALSLAGENLEMAIGLADRAISLNPGSGFAWFTSGWLRVILGEIDDGADRLERSMRLDPLSMLRPFQLSFLGLARFDQERFAEAATLLEQSIQLSVSHPLTYPLLAACYGYLGQQDAARRALDKRAMLSAQPIDAFAHWAFRAPRYRQLFLEGIALAELNGPTKLAERD